MNRSLLALFPVLLVVALAGIPAGCSSSQKDKEPAPAAAAPLSVEENAKVKVIARVKAIDQATRMVTLQDAQGREVTLVASSDVRRLNEVAVGDNVIAEYAVSLLAELRPPTTDEAANPIALVEVAERGPRGSLPAGAGARGVRLVTTVLAVDQPAMLVTLRGPGGDTVTVKGRKPENIAKVKVGDTIVITYVETAAISLEKAPK